MTSIPTWVLWISIAMNIAQIITVVIGLYYLRKAQRLLDTWGEK